VQVPERERDIDGGRAAEVGHSWATRACSRRMPFSHRS
jgi:hypothetical protein